MLLVIVGEFDSDNVGDQLIGEGHAALFAGHGCEIRIVSLEPGRNKVGTNFPTRRTSGLLKTAHRALYQRSAVYRHAIESLSGYRRRVAYRARAEECLAEADALLIGGGQLLSDGTLRMLQRLDHLTELAWERSIPVVAFGTGMSSGRTVLSRRLMRRVLNRLDEQSRFRDFASIEVAGSMRPGLNLSLTPTPDCAIAGIAQRRLLKPESGLVGIAPMAPEILSRIGIEVNDIDEWWIGIVRDLVRLGAVPVLFSTGVSADARYAGELQEKLAASGIDIDLLPRPTSTDALLSALSRMERVLAQRLHASISFYALGGVPASASWDKKVSEFYRRISLPGRVISIGSGDPADIARMLMAPAEPGVSREELAAESMLDAAKCVQELLRARGA